MLTRALLASIWAICTGLGATTVLAQNAAIGPSIVAPECTYYTATPNSPAGDWTLADPSEPVQQGNRIKADCAFGITVADAGETVVTVSSDLVGWHGQFRAQLADQADDITAQLSKGNPATPALSDNRQATLQIIGEAPRSENPVDAGEGYTHQLRHPAKYEIFRFAVTNGAADDEYLTVGRSAPASYLLVRSALNAGRTATDQLPTDNGWQTLAAAVLDEGYPDIARRILDTYQGQEATRDPILTRWGIIWGVGSTTALLIAIFIIIALAFATQGRNRAPEAPSSQNTRNRPAKRPAPANSRSRPSVNSEDL